MFKYLDTIFFLFLGTILSLPLLQSSAIAQDSPLICFIVKPSGELVDLTNLCNRKQEQDLSSEVAVQRLYQQAKSLAQRGLFQKAFNSLTQVLDIDPSFPEAYVERGNMRVALQDPQGAIEDLQKAEDLYSATGNSQGAASVQQRIKAIEQAFSLLFVPLLPHPRL